MKIGSCGTECRQGREGLGLAVRGLGGWVSRLAIVAWSELSTQFQLVRTDPQNEGENDLMTATIMYFSVDSSWKIIWEKLSCRENRKPLSFFSKLIYLQRSRLKASTINPFNLTMAQHMRLCRGLPFSGNENCYQTGHLRVVARILKSRRLKSFHATWRHPSFF